MADMVTTRKNDFGRILVAVLDPKLVSYKMQVIIGDHYFELDIAMEKIGFDENGDEVELDFGDGEDGGQGKEGDIAKEKKDDKMAKPDDPMDEDNSDGAALGDTSAEDNPILENKIMDMADQAIDLAVNMLIGECVDKVFGEDDGGMVDGLVEDVI